MGIKLTELTDRQRGLMSAKQRGALRMAAMTADEAQERFQAGQEKELQKLISNFLNLNEIYFETDRMDRKTSGAKGRPDFRICYRGRWLSVECKADKGRLSKEQTATLERIRKSGGIVIVAFGLEAVRRALREIDAQDRIVKDAMRAAGWKEAS